MLTLAVFISGNGSNLQAIIDAIAAGKLPATIAVVVSDKSDAYGLERAKKSGIPTIVQTKQDFPDRAEYGAKLIEKLQPFYPDMIILAGFMKILSNDFIAHYSNKILNIHPSLLPKYPGLKPHERALAAGDKQHGCTVHFVTEDLDAGPILGQATCPILPDDTPETLKQRVQALEHELYPQVIAQFCDG